MVAIFLRRPRRVYMVSSVVMVLKASVSVQGFQHPPYIFLRVFLSYEIFLVLPGFAWHALITAGEFDIHLVR